MTWHVMKLVEKNAAAINNSSIHPVVCDTTAACLRFGMAKLTI